MPVQTPKHFFKCQFRHGALSASAALFNCFALPQIGKILLTNLSTFFTEPPDIYGPKYRTCFLLLLSSVLDILLTVVIVGNFSSKPTLIY